MAERVWMKTLQEQNYFEPKKPGGDYLLEEPAWRDEQRRPKHNKDGRPSGRPSWTIGERVVLYVGGRPNTAALLRITAGPEESKSEDWPWSTAATVIKIDGPTLREIGVDPAMTMRRVRWRLTPEQTQRALRAFGA